MHMLWMGIWWQYHLCLLNGSLIYSANRFSVIIRDVYIDILLFPRIARNCLCMIFFSCRGSACQQSSNIQYHQVWCILLLHCITHSRSYLQSVLLTPEGWHTSASDWDTYQHRPSHQVFWSCTWCALQNTGGCSEVWWRKCSQQCNLHHSARWWAMAATLALELLCK